MRCAHHNGWRCEWQVTYDYLCNEVQAQCWVRYIDNEMRSTCISVEMSHLALKKNLFVLFQPAICNWDEIAHRCENELGQNCLITSSGTKSAFTFHLKLSAAKISSSNTFCKDSHSLQKISAASFVMRSTSIRKHRNLQSQEQPMQRKGEASSVCTCKCLHRFWSAAEAGAGFL
jgi:hypothetical protein